MLDVATIRMRTEAEMPYSSCLSWKNEEKSFSCYPSKCVGLSDWLSKHASKTPDNPWVEEIQ